MDGGCWVRVSARSDLTTERATAVHVDGVSIALYLIDDEVFATSNICTHQFALLSDGFIDGDLIECPLHAGSFDIRTGLPCAEPAETPLQIYETRVVDGSVEIFIP